MDSLIEIKYFNMNHFDEVNLFIENRFTLLKDRYEAIKSCYVSVTRMDSYFGKKGNCYKIGINLEVAPDKSLFVVRNPDYGKQSELLEPVIKDVFSTIEKQLEETTQCTNSKAAIV